MTHERFAKTHAGHSLIEVLHSISPVEWAGAGVVSRADGTAWPEYPPVVKWRFREHDSVRDARLLEAFAAFPEAPAWALLSHPRESGGIAWGLLPRALREMKDAGHDDAGRVLADTQPELGLEARRSLQRLAVHLRAWFQCAPPE
jgi:hypothetical protein